MTPDDTEKTKYWLAASCLRTAFTQYSLVQAEDEVNVSKSARDQSKKWCLVQADAQKQCVIFNVTLL